MNKRPRTTTNPLGAGRKAMLEPSVPFNARLPLSVAAKLHTIAANKTAFICNAINVAYDEFMKGNHD